MDKILYKSCPRLLILTTTLGGFAFMGLLSRLCWVKCQNPRLPVLFLSAFFCLIAIWAFYLFLKINVVKLSANAIEFSYLLLPIRRKFPLQEVMAISQHTRRLAVWDGLKSPSRINYRVTTFTFRDNRIIKMNSLGPFDFEELTRCYNKIARGNTEVKVMNKKLAQYLIENIEDLWIVAVILISIIGLGVSRLTN
jgi:hypothetical protein